MIKTPFRRDAKGGFFNSERTNALNLRYNLKHVEIQGERKMNNNNDMQSIIENRIYAIRQAHANNMIENMDMGAEVLEGMIQRAREPISNEEFTRREKALWQQRHLQKYLHAA
ncbi:hypothetical protein AGMMS49545_19220 [Betaproteobacteria bacterium]|nr:hypothetical protein AGMMS49545_19220 [Betaproteobacteria bacterium]GHU49233.1 hypothetical protein AGMMS50289_26270 [Betaproteobacteria bacterium]